MRRAVRAAPSATIAMLTLVRRSVPKGQKLTAFSDEFDAMEKLGAGCRSSA